MPGKWLPVVRSVIVKDCVVKVAGSMGVLNCTVIAALIGTPLSLLCGFVFKTAGVTVSVAEPVENELWNSGDVWFPVTSVTATVIVALAGRFCAGGNVTDKLSLDRAKVPTTLFAPWDKVIIPGVTAET